MIPVTDIPVSFICKIIRSIKR